MSADIILSGAQLAQGLTPASWKFGAVVIGVLLTQIVGFLWYSPAVFGNIWLNYQPELKKKLASGNVDLKSRILTSTMGDLVLAVFLSIFCHPDSLVSVMVMSTFLVALNLLMQFPNMVWQDQKLGLVLINHGFDAMSVVIKLLALAYIPF